MQNQSSCINIGVFNRSHSGFGAFSIQFRYISVQIRNIRGYFKLQSFRDFRGSLKIYLTCTNQRARWIADRSSDQGGRGSEHMEPIDTRWMQAGVARDMRGIAVRERALGPGQPPGPALPTRAWNSSGRLHTWQLQLCLTSSSAISANCRGRQVFRGGSAVDCSGNKKACACQDKPLTQGSIPRRRLRHAAASRTRMTSRIRAAQGGKGARSGAAQRRAAGTGVVEAGTCTKE